MKKLIALVTIGAMLCAMPVMAATSSNAEAVAANAIPKAIQEAAAENNMTVPEYTNNAVVELPGLSEVTPIGQGGHVIINGAPSNVVFQLVKPAAKVVTEAKNQATALGGKVLNVVTTKAAVNKFGSAVVNFYMKGVKAGQLIEVYQLVDGVWVKLTVAEIREDHVVINMTAHGTLAFIEVPAAPAAK